MSVGCVEFLVQMLVRLHDQDYQADDADWAVTAEYIQMVTDGIADEVRARIRASYPPSQTEA